MLTIEGDSNHTSVETKIEPSCIPIQCGLLEGKLHVKHFFCPGIHEKCIEVCGEIELITPKEFTIRANKDKQKDWKGSIRIGKSNLRTLMERRIFDFHDHLKFCNGRCQSRNYISSKETERSSSRKGSAFSVQSSNETIDQPRRSVVEILAGADITDLVSKVLNNSSFELTSVSSSPSSSTPMTEEAHDDDKHQQSPMLHDLPKMVKQMESNPLLFWTFMSQNGLANIVLDHMIEKINEMRGLLAYGRVDAVASTLSKAVEALGVADGVAPLAILTQLVKRTTNAAASTSADDDDDDDDADDDNHDKADDDSGETQAKRRRRCADRAPFDITNETFASQSLKLIADMAQEHKPAI
ncbi:unnamed protein product [Caenorhabditis bovis]|uniref:SAND domain-containing protein n=1 Tax=Caenorhabditis bovis TaxID=2654633 RepID=A0A8S1EH69_9PELO|nr:unnamed protein product [Caenorhabditis bovis]